MKKIYITPNIQKVVLDKEISLQLASPGENPTANPWESGASGKAARQGDPYQYEDW